MAIARFAVTPRVPKASQNGAFEALGGQEHVIAAHLDGEGTAFGATLEGVEEGQFKWFLDAYVEIRIIFRLCVRRFSDAKSIPNIFEN